MIPAISSRRAGPPFVSESVFEYLHVEVIKYVQKQYAVEKFIEQGFEETEAHIQSRAFVAAKLESIGFDVGYRLGERYSKDIHFLQVDRLALIKYFCLHIWTNVFGKHVDKLRSDSSGLYVLHECSFPWISQISCSSEAEADWRCRPYTQLAVGIVRGALTNLGLAPEVCLEFDFSKSETKPGCLFYIVDHNHPRQLLRQRQIMDRDTQARFEQNLREIQLDIERELAQGQTETVSDQNGTTITNSIEADDQTRIGVETRAEQKDADLNEALSVTEPELQENVSSQQVQAGTNTENMAISESTVDAVQPESVVDKQDSNPILSIVPESTESHVNSTPKEASDAEQEE